MIQKNSLLYVLDNTTPSLVKCIHVYSVNNKHANLGDFVYVTVKRTLKKKRLSKKIKQLDKGSLVKAVIVNCKKNCKRFDGSYINFSKNRCLLVNKQMNFMGTRILGPLSLELKRIFSLNKALILAPFVF